MRFTFFNCKFNFEFHLINLMPDSTRVEFSPEPVTQSRSPFHPIPTYSPSSISGSATMGSTFSTIGSISSNIGGSLGAASVSTPTSSIQLTPTLSEDQVIRLTRAAERYYDHILLYIFTSSIILFVVHFQIGKSISISRNETTKHKKAINT